MTIAGIELYDIFLSILRWVFGLFIGSLIGLLLGIIANFYNSKVRIFFSIFNFFRAIPIIGLVPVIQINFGIKEYGKIGLIAWAVTFPVWIAVKTTLNKDISNSLLILKGAKLSKREYLQYFHYPRILSGFLKGIDIGIGIAWLSVVAAEWVGTYNTGFWSGGLGYKLDLAYTTNNWAGVYFSLLIFGILGLVSSYLYNYLIHFFISKQFNMNIEL